MRVLFATNFPYLPQRTGGSESSTDNLCRALLKQGHRVAVVAGLISKDFTWLINRLSAKITKRDFPSDSRLTYPVFRGWNVEGSIEQVINSFSPDVAIVQAGQPFGLVNTFAFLGIPVIFYVRDVEFDSNKQILITNSLVAMIANSAFTASRVKACLGVDAWVLPPLVDPQEYIVKTRRRSVLHVGLNSKKGIETTFELARRLPDIPFVAVESWPLTREDFLRYQTQARGLRNVKLCRRTKDMRKHYADAKVLLVPSACEEAWGRVVTEAQVSGIPAIASARGGLPESVGDAGILIEPYTDIAQWEKALLKLWNDDAAYGEYSRNAIRRSMSEDVSADRLATRLVELLNIHILACKNWPSPRGDAEPS